MPDAPSRPDKTRQRRIRQSAVLPDAARTPYPAYGRVPCKHDKNRSAPGNNNIRHLATTPSNLFHGRLPCFSHKKLFVKNVMVMR